MAWIHTRPVDKEAASFLGTVVDCARLGIDRFFPSARDLA